MKNNYDHIVHSLRYEVQFDDNSMNNQHNALSQLHYERIEQLLQKAFDKISVKGKHIQINTFELDLGIITKDNWQNNFISQLDKVLNDKLNDAIIKEAASIDIIRLPEYIEDSLDVVIRSEKEQEEEAFLFFLERGFIKWNISSPSTISVNTVFENIIERNDAKFNQKISALLIKSDVALQRFIFQILQELQIRWFSYIAPGSEKNLDEILSILPNQIQHYLKVPQAIIDKLFLWLKKELIRSILANKPASQSALKFIETHTEGISEILSENITKEIINKNFNSADRIEKNLLHLIIQKLSEKEKLVSEILERKEKSEKVKAKQDNISEHKDFYKQKEKQREKKKKHITPKSAEINSESKTDIEISDEEIARTKEGKESIELETTVDAEIKENKKQDFEKGVLATNAGLVILWPYLTALFNEFHLTNNDQFRGEEEIIKALFILHYLATGEIKTEEHALLIPKIITGCNNEINIPLEITLEERIVKECDNLLQSAIKNWKVLKSTSPNGLRQAFLQRKAFIKLADESWEFLFERKGMDVLIDHLPFGLSVIKFKWLDNPIYVTW